MEKVEDKSKVAKTQEPSQDKYEILKEDYLNIDLSFKILIIGNSGKFYNLNNFK